MTAINVVEFASFIIYTVLFFGVGVLLVIATIRNLKLRKEVDAISYERLNYVLRLAELEEAKDSENIENTQGFLKFVSESREYAFEYIEDVQQALRAYDIALHTDDAKIINDAYKKLISFLPEDDMVE